MLWTGDAKTGHPTTVKEWCAKGYTWESMPPIRCACGEVVDTTRINELQMGRGLGCKACKRQASTHDADKSYMGRRDEVEAAGEARGFDLLTTVEEWPMVYTNVHFKPTWRCRTHSSIITTTSINNLMRGRGIGCLRCMTQIDHWRFRHDEFVEILAELGCALVDMTREQWEAECMGEYFKPRIRCLEHPEHVIESTNINNLTQCGRVGCPSCRNKTEKKLYKWLCKHCPEAFIEREFPGPIYDGKTRFDFRLTFPDGFVMIIELDGAQHFWDVAHFKTSTDVIAKRDLFKEQWAMAEGKWVVRVLQTDVWGDTNAWEDYLLKSIADACATPPTPEKHVIFPRGRLEYTGDDSAYAKAHKGPGAPVQPPITGFYNPKATSTDVGSSSTDPMEECA